MNSQAQDHITCSRFQTATVFTNTETGRVAVAEHRHVYVYATKDDYVARRNGAVSGPYSGVTAASVAARRAIEKEDGGRGERVAVAMTPAQIAKVEYALDHIRNRFHDEGRRFPLSSLPETTKTRLYFYVGAPGVKWALSELCDELEDTAERWRCGYGEAGLAQQMRACWNASAAIADAWRAVAGEEA